LSDEDPGVVAVAVQLLALRLPQAVILQTTFHGILCHFNTFACKFYHPKGSGIPDSIFPVLWIRTGVVSVADPDPAFVSMRIWIGIQGTKPMPINAVRIQIRILVTKKLNFYMKNILKA
jgi:hypothetical protein